MFSGSIQFKLGKAAMVICCRECDPFESALRRPPHPTSFTPGNNSVVVPAPALQAVPWGNMANYMYLQESQISGPEEAKKPA